MKRSTWIYLSSGTLIITGLGCGVCLMLVLMISLFTAPTQATAPPRIVRLPAGPINSAPGQSQGPVTAPAGPNQEPAAPVEPGAEQSAEQSVDQAVEQASEGQAAPAEENAATTDLNSEQTEAAVEEVTQTEPTPAPVAPTIVNDARMVIANLDRAREYVDLKNIGGEAQELRGWRLVSSQGKEECPLGGTVAAGETLRIWSREIDLEQGGYNCGFQDEIWVDESDDAAILYNANGDVVYQRK
ncbi:MAG: lamin tail domain-containing protein [Anaerolineae bacterium]|nr:lamin tail domain-containing protein [Anaerolineae bacterium]